MRFGTWQFKAGLIAAGAALCVAGGLAGPKATLWYAKRVAMRPFGRMQPSELAGMNWVPAKQVRKIPAAPLPDRTIQWAGDGYRFILPAEAFGRSTDANQPFADRTFVSEKAKVCVLQGHAAPAYKPASMSSNAEVAGYFGQTDPYQIMADSFDATPADLASAQTHAALQKGLYLLLMKTTLATKECGKLWQRIEVGGRKGFLSGDTTCRVVLVDLYCPQTRYFAALGLFPAKGATMDDVYRCLGQIRIETSPPASGGASSR